MITFQLIYEKNGSAPQIKRNIRKFAGFDKDEKQKKLDQLKKSEESLIKQTAVILALEVGDSDTKDKICEDIVDFLISPNGKTIEEHEKENPRVEEDEEDEESEEEIKPKAKPAKGRSSGSTGGSRPKRSAASAKAWTEGNFRFRRNIFSILHVNFYLYSFLDFGDSEGEEEVEEAQPRRKKKRNESDSGSDVNFEN